MNMRYIGPNISFIFTKIKELLNSHNTNSSAHSELFKSWVILNSPTNAEIVNAIAAIYKKGVGDVLVNETNGDATKLFFRPSIATVEIPVFGEHTETLKETKGIYITTSGEQGQYTASHTDGTLTLKPASSNAVTYASQTLTDAQKQQARTNIGAVSESDVNDKLPIDIKMMLIHDNSNVVIPEDGIDTVEILLHIINDRQVRLIYQDFTYYLNKQGWDATSILTSLSFAACANNTPSADNPDGNNVLSMITYDFNKDEFTVTTEGRYINPIDGIVESDLSADIQKTLTNANAITETGVGLIRYIKMVDADTTGSGIVVPDNSDETYYTIKQYINSDYTVILLYKGVPYSLNYTKVINNNISLYYFHAILSSDATSTVDTASEIKTVVAGNNFQFKVTTKPLYISATVSNNTLIIR